ARSLPSPIRRSRPFANEYHVWLRGGRAAAGSMPKGARLMPTYRIYFAGHVQGVGFRATCQQLARRLPHLAGQVCNLPDGRVSLIVRGEADDVDRLLEQLRAAFVGYLRDVQRT